MKRNHTYEINLINKTVVVSKGFSWNWINVLELLRRLRRGSSAFLEGNWSKEDPRQSRRSSMVDTLFAQRIGGDAGAAKSVSVLLRCEAPVLDGWRDSGLADNDIVAVVGAPIIHIIAACFKAAPLLVIRKVVSLLVLNGEVKPQFALVFFKELDVEKFIRNNEWFVGIAVKEIKRFKVAPVSSPCLCDVGRRGGVGNEVVHLPAYVDAGFASGIEDKQVVFRWHFFVFQNVGARPQLFVVEGVVCVRGAPYTNRMAARRLCLFLTLFHHLNVLHIQHPAFSFWYLRKQLRQAAVWARGFVLVLPQDGLVDGNDVLRASQSFKRFWRCGNTHNQSAPARCGFTDGVARDTRNVWLGAVCGEQNDVMRFIADDDLKVCGKVGIVLYADAELRVGGYDRFVGAVFFAKWQMGCARVLLKKYIGARQGFVLCQTQIAVLGVDEKKCLVRR